MKPDAITIRAARAGDAPALSRLVRRNADAVLAVDYTQQQLAAWKRHNTPALWRQHIATRLCFVAARAARLCGTIALEQDELVGLYISPARRGEGIGRRLLARLEQAAIQHGHRKLWLTSSPSAASYYLAHGWKKRRQVTLNILGVDFEETLMTRTLTSAS
jgi:N-acetylglutamate synthase-like GNAT family acetyltransferase